MKTFNNDKNRIEAERGVMRMGKGLFWVSVCTSAICVVGIGLELLRSETPDLHNYVFTGDTAFAAKIALYLGVLYILHFVEFYGIALSAKMVFTEFAGFMAARNGLVAKYNAMRQTSLVLWSCIFFVSASFSAATSYYGSKAIGAIAASRINTDKVQNLPRERTKAVTENTATQREKLEALRKERDAAIAKAEAQISGETKRLAKRGNEWAKNEIANATNSAARPYASKIAKAESELAAAEKDANARYDKVETTMLKAAESEISSAENKGKTVSLLTSLLGILPTLMGISIVGITSMSEVAAKAGTRQNNDADDAHATQSRAYSQRSKSGF